MKKDANRLNERAQLSKTEPKSDFELAQLCGDGDMHAYEELYKRHHMRIYNLCYRMTNDAATGEDMTQEVFIQLYRKAKSFRGDSKFYTWLHRMAVNIVLMHFRKTHKSKEFTVKEDGELIIFSDKNTDLNYGNYTRNPILDKVSLDKAIQQLASGYRNVYILHDIEGYEHEEVAKILGISTGTSKSQLHKARLKLKTILNQKVNPKVLQVTTPVFIPAY